MKIAITAANLHGATLHWAVNDWAKPAEDVWPPGTVAVDEKAVQTPVPGASLALVFPEVGWQASLD